MTDNADEQRVSMGEIPDDQRRLQVRDKLGRMKVPTMEVVNPFANANPDLPVILPKKRKLSEISSEIDRLLDKSKAELLEKQQQINDEIKVKESLDYSTVDPDLVSYYDSTVRSLRKHLTRIEAELARIARARKE